MKTTISFFYPERNHIDNFPATGSDIHRIAFSYHCDGDGIV